VELDTAALEIGAVIPGYVLSKPVGSRGDIETLGTWSDGKWVVVIRRPLNTGHDDDVVYIPSISYCINRRINPSLEIDRTN